MVKIAIIVSHPIQHFCPQYASFARHKSISLKVFFASSLGLKPYNDVHFKQQVCWNNLDVDRFEHCFLNGEKVLQADKDLDASNVEVELANFAPELIIVHGYFQRFQKRAYTWAVKNKIAIAYISDAELRHKSNKILELIKSVFLQRYFSRIQFFLTVGNSNEHFYLKNGVSRNKFIRMHFPIDRDLYEKAFENKVALNKLVRSNYNISPTSIVLSVVGKLVKWKNQVHLIKAVKLLEKQNVFFEVFIIGSGHQLNRLKAESSTLSKTKIHFTGFVNDIDLPGYYAATNIYVHPAEIEPHSLAISEAIYMGCPVIISNSCGSYGDDDDVQNGKNGFVYEFGKIEELAEKIKTLVEQPFMRKKFGFHSHSIAKSFQEISHVSVIDRIEKAFHESAFN